MNPMKHRRTYASQHMIDEKQRSCIDPPMRTNSAYAHGGSVLVIRISRHLSDSVQPSCQKKDIAGRHRPQHSAAAKGDAIC